jgi:hypothetical protein
MRKRSASRTRRPPPSLDGYRILYFAIVKRPVKYSGHSYLFIDGKELGPVPRLVIGESLEDSEVAILHADARGTFSAFKPSSTPFGTQRSAQSECIRAALRHGSRRKFRGAKRKITSTKSGNRLRAASAGRHRLNSKVRQFPRTSLAQSSVISAFTRFRKSSRINES